MVFSSEKPLGATDFKKVQKKYFGKTNPWNERINTWYAYTTWLCE